MEIMSLKSKIASLKADLIQKQDPQGVQETQRLISVSPS